MSSYETTVTGFEPGGQALLRIDDVDLWVTLLDEYRPGLWQARTDAGTQFVVSTHVLMAVRGDAD